ncbi:MAG: helix-turn-helix transcriptional regulator [Bacillota bacterium]|nr:helix-turn-helix transcriptional regulator [Bacillota bacterium]
MNLRELRRKNGYQRKFVAEKVNICGKHLNDIEAARVNLTEKVANKLSIFYNIELDKIKNMYLEGKKNGKSINISSTTTANKKNQKSISSN